MRCRARSLSARAAAGAVLLGIGVALAGCCVALGGVAVAMAVPGLAVPAAAQAATTPTDTTTTGTTTTGSGARTDAISGRAALTDYQSYLVALVNGESAGQQRALAFAAVIKARCAGALATVATLPTTEVDQLALSDLGEELGADLTLEYLSEANAPFAQLSAQLGALSWSQPAPALVVEGLLQAEGRMLALAPSALCADARALTHRPLTAPAGSLAFLNSYLRYSAVLKARFESFLALLSRYATPSDAAVITAIDRLVAQFDASSTAAEKTGATVLLTALGLTPSAQGAGRTRR